ncbi:MAG: type II secretion system protein [Petrotogales bacterium]
MRRRKEGFSLVELLIVLAVMAALIATITPVAMNAIRKSKATKVAQNLKSMGTAFENYLYVNDEAPEELTDLGRDIDDDAYGIAWETADGSYLAIAYTNEDADIDTVKEALPNATTEDITYDEAGDLGLSYASTYTKYSLEFQVY